MSELKSCIIYGINVVNEKGDLSYDAANIISSIADKYDGVEARWAGRNGQEPSYVVIGIVLEDYTENDSCVVLEELLQKEKVAERTFPILPILRDVENLYKEHDCLKNVDYDNIPYTMIIHTED